MKCCFLGKAGMCQQQKWWVQHSPRSSTAGEEASQSPACTLCSWQIWTLVAEVQHSCFSFIFSLGWPFSYFPRESTAPRFVPHPQGPSTSQTTSYPPCSPWPLLQTASHCAQLVLESSRWVQILGAGVERLHNGTSPTSLPTTGSSGNVDFRFLQQSDGL